MEAPTIQLPMHTHLYVDVYGNDTVVFDGYDGGPSTKGCAHPIRP